MSGIGGNYMKQKEMITATHAGMCAICAQAIYAGDSIYTGSRVVVHQGCYMNYPQRAWEVLNSPTYEE